MKYCGNYLNWQQFPNLKKKLFSCSACVDCRTKIEIVNLHKKSNIKLWSVWLKGGFNLYIFKNLFRTTLSSSWPRPLPHPLFFQVNFKKVKVSLQLPQMLRSENQQDHQVPNFPQVRLNPPKALKSPLQVKIIRNDIDAFCRQNWWIIVLSFTYFEKAKKCDIYFCLMDRKVFVTTAAGTGKSLSEAPIFTSTNPQ